MTWVAVGVGVVGAGASLYGSSKASKDQKNGANSALAEQQREYDTTRNDNQTALDARNFGLAQMQSLAGSFKSGPTQEDVLNSPGYQFGLTQGQNRVNQNAAATGGLYSGAQLRATNAFGNDYATTKYDDQLNNLRNSQNDQFNRYASLSGQGQIGANAINSAGQNMANQNSATYQNQGTNNAAAALTNANTFTNFANQAGSGLANWYNQPSSNGATSFSSGSNYNDQNYSHEGRNYPTYGTGYADGGPVRQEPTVGTMGPVRDGGGGNLSSKAILDAIVRRQAARVMKDGVGALPANPVTHPGAVLQAQEDTVMRAHGGAVHGPGGPRDDAIPARLSNGEHVFDVASVNALGDGDNALGQARLNMLRSKLHGVH